MAISTFTPTRIFAPDPFALMTDEESEAYIAAHLSRDALFRFAYVPFVIADYIWDMADTVCDQMSIMRLDRTKQLCRRIRGLYREYRKLRAPYLNGKAGEREKENSEVFQRYMAKSRKKIMLSLDRSLRCSYPALDCDGRWTIKAAYLCMATMRALLRYTDAKAEETRLILRLRTIGRILPPQVYELSRLLPLLVGDKEVSEKMKARLTAFSDECAEWIDSIELNEEKYEWE